MEGYKVVRPSLMPGIFTSAILSCHDGTMWYKIGKVAHRKAGDGPLAVFGRVEDAKEFCNIHCSDTGRIFKCVYTPTKLKTKWLWYMRQTGEKVTRMLLPRGTVLADSVKLLEGNL